jgi:hypothetical protein
MSTLRPTARVWTWATRSSVRPACNRFLARRIQESRVICVHCRGTSAIACKTLTAWHQSTASTSLLASRPTPAANSAARGPRPDPLPPVSQEQQLLCLMGAQHAKVPHQHGEGVVAGSKRAIVDGACLAEDLALVIDDVQHDQLGLAPWRIIAAMPRGATPPTAPVGQTLAEATAVSRNDDPLPFSNPDCGGAAVAFSSSAFRCATARWLNWFTMRRVCLCPRSMPRRSSACLPARTESLSARG